MKLNRDLFTDIVIVLNSMAAIYSVLSMDLILALMFSMNAGIMFHYMVSKEK